MAAAWEKNTEDNFKKMIAKTPPFIRDIARSRVSQSAERLAQEAGRSEVGEKDMVDAFFKETPGGFWGPLQVDMEALGLDYTKYGYERV